MTVSMFDRYGGFATVRMIVSSFYDKVLDSDRLHRFFVDIDMRALVDHQTKFVASLMGGPASYCDETLRRVHERLGITHADFAESAVLLRETLEEFDVDLQDIDQVCYEFQRREAYIVSSDLKGAA